MNLSFGFFESKWERSGPLAKVRNQRVCLCISVEVYVYVNVHVYVGVYVYVNLKLFTTFKARPAVQTRQVEKHDPFGGDQFLMVQPP